MFKLFSIAVLSFAALSGLCACDQRALPASVQGIAHHMVPMDNFGEILHKK